MQQQQKVILEKHRRDRLINIWQFDWIEKVK